MLFYFIFSLAVSLPCYAELSTGIVTRLPDITSLYFLDFDLNCVTLCYDPDVQQFWKCSIVRNVDHNVGLNFTNMSTVISLIETWACSRGWGYWKMIVNRSCTESRDHHTLARAMALWQMKWNFHSKARTVKFQVKLSVYPEFTTDFCLHHFCKKKKATGCSSRSWASTASHASIQTGPRITV